MSAVHSGPISQNPERALEDLVQRFSAALLEKLRSSERKYGWQNAWLRADWTNECRHKLRRHIEKGDPLDTAAFCAFLWHHREPTVSSVAGKAPLAR